MRTNRTLLEWDKWCRARTQIAEELKRYYQASMSAELPPRLVEVLKQLDNELPNEQKPQ